MLRLFWAYGLPSQAISALSRLQAGLKADYPGLRWVQPGNIHLTLHFLGDTPRRRIDELISGLGACLESEEAGFFSLERLGVFPAWDKPRVLWLDLEGNLVLLQRQHQKSLAVLKEMGLNLDDRPFSPHITLARINQVPPGGILGLKNYQVMEKAPFLLDRLTLYASDLTPRGPVYTSLYTIYLQNAIDKPGGKNYN